MIHQAAKTYADVVLGQKPAAYWPLGADVREHLTLADPTDIGTNPVQSIRQGARGFTTAGNSRLDLGTPAAIMDLDEISFSVWFRMDALTGSFPTIFCQRNLSTSPFAVVLRSNDSSYQLLIGNSDPNASVDYPALVPTIGRWHHVAGSIVGSTLRVMLDGVMQANQTLTMTGSATVPWCIGNRSGGGRGINAAIQHLAIWTTGWTEFSVAQHLYLAGINGAI